jgi:DNA invertase Pin-like site-specific DNA recombinase
MTTVGYARVSAKDQNLEIQMSQLNAAGCERIYSEKMSGKNTRDRPEFKKMMDYLREGDVLVITKLDRLARSTADLINIVKTLDSKNIGFKVLNQNIDTTTPQGRLMFTMLAAFAEFERDTINERTAEGIEKAKAKGVKFGRKPTITDEQRLEIVEMAKDYKNTKQYIADHFGINIATVFQILKDHRESQ